MLVKPIGWPIQSHCQQNFALLITDRYSTVAGSRNDKPRLTRDLEEDGAGGTLADIA